jgi:hypothetical protein
MDALARVLDEARAAALIANESLASLAACDGERLDNAVVCVASEGLRLYFGAFSTTLKASLMIARPIVALTIGPIQYHGAARIIRRGTDEYGSARAIYDRKFPQYAELFESAGNALFEVRPLALWLYETSSGALSRPVLIKDETYFSSLARPAESGEASRKGRGAPDMAREIDFLALEREAIALAAANPVAVLATASRGRVTARSMSFLWSGLEAWFQTSAASEKWAQVSESPEVAICAGNMQYEGMAEPRGGCRESGNEWFLARYPAVHPGSFSRYGALPEERVVLVRPGRIAIWKYEDGLPCRDLLDPISRKAWRERVPSLA